MKKLISRSLVPAAAIAFAAAPTAALADGPYVGISGGVALPEDSNNTGAFDATVDDTDDFDEIPAGTPLGWTTEFDTGFAISGVAGYAFESGFRLEAEVAYSQYDVSTHRDLTVGGTNIDGVDVAILTRGDADDDNPSVGAVIADGQGQVSNLGVFANVYYDFNAEEAFKPYIGGGIGYQWVDAEYVPSGVPVGEDDDGAFSYQLMAGASYALSDSVEIFGQYTFRDTTEEADIELDLVPATLGVESTQSIISAGVRISFGD